MEQKIIFTERQQFRQLWLWIILISVNGLILFGVYKKLVQGQQFGDKPMSNFGLIFSAAVGLALIVMFAIIKLQTTITTEGIHVKFIPFVNKFYSWNEIAKAYTRKYNPIAEYGGWGFRLGIFGRGKAYNISGNQGLQLVFNNDKKLLIGTKKPEELAKALTEIGRFEQ